MRNNRRLFVCTSSALTLIVLGGFAVAQGAALGSVTGAGRKVMDKASQSNIAEIEEGRLALTHSRNAQVQAFGNRLVQDHSKAEDALEALAASVGVKLPATPNAKEQQQIAQLGGLQGAAFDRLFAASEVGAHRKAITNMSRAASTVKNLSLIHI